MRTHMSEVAKEIANKVKKILAETGVSETAFAKRIGISQSQLNRLLKGESEPSAYTIEKIADAVGMNVIAMMFGTDEPRVMYLEPTPREALRVIEGALRDQEENWINAGHFPKLLRESLKKLSRLDASQLDQLAPALTAVEDPLISILETVPEPAEHPISGLDVGSKTR